MKPVIVVEEEKTTKGWSLSLEVRVGLLILVSIMLLTTCVMALGITSPKPAQRPTQTPGLTITEGPFEIECSQERTLVCRCE